VQKCTDVSKFQCPGRFFLTPYSPKFNIGLTCVIWPSCRKANSLSNQLLQCYTFALICSKNYSQTHHKAHCRDSIFLSQGLPCPTTNNKEQKLRNFPAWSLLSSGAFQRPCTDVSTYESDGILATQWRVQISSIVEIILWSSQYPCHIVEIAEVVLINRLFISLLGFSVIGSQLLPLPEIPS
jgi:hypothetical protein